MTIKAQKFPVIEPKVGMHVYDPAFPKDDWEVLQLRPVVYIRRQDGLLYHHTKKSWESACESGYLREVAPTSPSEGRS